MMRGGRAHGWRRRRDAEGGASKRRQNLHPPRPGPPARAPAPAHVCVLHVDHAHVGVLVVEAQQLRLCVADEITGVL
jgi:hypothetical protein